MFVEISENENKEDSAGPCLESKAKATVVEKTFGTIFEEWNIWFEVNGKYRFSASNVIYLLLGLLSFTLITTIIYHHRISVLEADRDQFIFQLNKTHDEIRELRYLIELPSKSDSDDDDDDDEAFSLDTDEKENLRIGPLTGLFIRSKRAINENETSLSSKNLWNDTSVDNMKIGRPAVRFPLPLASREERNRKIKERGNRSVRMSQSKRKDGTNDREKILISKLKKCRRNCKGKTKLASAILKASSFNEAQTVIIIPAGLTMDITEPMQRIGPWYMDPTGESFGSGDKYWYKGLSLDKNKTSIIFNESGLFMIGSQILYHISPAHDENPGRMGYQIYLIKNENNKTHRRSIVLAQSVPAFPQSYYQTCYTQINIPIDAGDQIYLEHFTKALPIIEADSPGKTFLQVTKLSR